MLPTSECLQFSRHREDYKTLDVEGIRSSTTELQLYRRRDIWNKKKPNQDIMRGYLDSVFLRFHGGIFSHDSLMRFFLPRRHSHLSLATRSGEENQKAPGLPALDSLGYQPVFSMLLLLTSQMTTNSPSL